MGVYENRYKKQSPDTHGDYEDVWDLGEGNCAWINPGFRSRTPYPILENIPFAILGNAFQPPLKSISHPPFRKGGIGGIFLSLTAQVGRHGKSNLP